MADGLNLHLLEVLKISRVMMELADKGDASRTDRSCGVLYGKLRDTAFELQEMAEREIDLHRKIGIWDIETEI